jgi:prepilin-type N-terminal cleavage/methylation domain-containing protein
MLKRFLQQLKTRTEGFSLIEIMAAIVIMGIVLVPVCNAMLSSVSVNRSSNEILQARLAVSSAVESMMAEGVQYTVTTEGGTDQYDAIVPDFSGVTVSIDPYDLIGHKTDNAHKPAYYEVTVTETEPGGTREAIEITTHIRAVEKITNP